MNMWVKKSIALFNSKGYLDDLFEVYPVNSNLRRDIVEGLRIEVETIFREKRERDLIKKLLKFSKFPLNDPYIASLRKCPELLDKNPETVQRIGKKLLAMGLDNIFEMVSEPKSSSRQFGNTFQNWLPSLDIPFLFPEEIINKNVVAFLKGSDSQLKEFAKNALNLKRLNRRPDFIAKVKNKYIIGEAKFLTSDGGTQNNQFDNALKTGKIRNEKCVGIAVVDGVLWLDGRAHMQRKIRKFTGNACSALLLKDFIRQFNKN